MANSFVLLDIVTADVMKGDNSHDFFEKRGSVIIYGTN